MLTAEAIAEQATLQSLLNCYLRETGAGEWVKAVSAPSELRPGRAALCLCELRRQGIQLLLGVEYRSRTGHHRYSHVHYRAQPGAEPIPGDYLTIGALLIKELALAEGEPTSTDELLLRLIESCRCTEQYAQSRLQGEMADPATDFLAAEQSLFTGHPFHPTPKSRQGIDEAQASRYCPELGGRFRLHYFLAHRSLIEEASATPQSATELLRQELLAGAGEGRPELERLLADGQYAPLPVHPLQAAWLLGRPEVQRRLGEGTLRDLGELGRAYAATSSLRTVYHLESAYMLKFSVRVKLTNSLRVMKRKELASGVEISRLLATPLGEAIGRYPGFEIIRDPAYATLRIADDAAESGFEVVLRDNPFQRGSERDCCLIAALVQDPLPGERSLLASIIHTIAVREQRAVTETAIDWFRRYLAISLRPIVGLYLSSGIALEAHQQNCVLRMSKGYPDKLYFRDNQGYYFSRSMRAELERELPGIGAASGDIYDDNVTDEHLIYYLMINHLFGLIGGFGHAGLVDERLLLLELRRELTALQPLDRPSTRFLQRLLTAERLPCKANLLTRLRDMDELELPLERQSVYVPISNPLMNRSVRRLAPERSGEQVLTSRAGGGR